MNGWMDEWLRFIVN